MELRLMTKRRTKPGLLFENCPIWRTSYQHPNGKTQEMAIGSITIDWLIHLSKNGMNPSGASIFELGTQDISTTRAVVERAARTLQGNERARFMVDAIFDGQTFRPNAQLAFYELFGASRYQSADLSDPRADFPFDLNKPIAIEETFDIVTDFGTAEHVFNIGEVYSSIHNLLKVGGIALFTSPTFGFINHGFYNLHPLVFEEMANFNHYDVVDIRYIDNLYVRCLKREENPDEPFAFDSLPIEARVKPGDPADVQRLMSDVALRFKHNLEDSDTARLTGNQFYFVFDMLYVAVRKTESSAAKFVTPYQGGF